MKPDERDFLRMVAALGRYEFVRDLINRDDFPMHHKRAWYLLRKWTERGWYAYGVSLDLGWLTEAGRTAANDALAEANP